MYIQPIITFGDWLQNCIQFCIRTLVFAASSSCSSVLANLYFRAQTLTMVLRVYGKSLTSLYQVGKSHFSSTMLQEITMVPPWRTVKFQRLSSTHNIVTQLLHTVVHEIYTSFTAQFRWMVLCKCEWIIAVILISSPVISYR